MQGAVAVVSNQVRLPPAPSSSFFLLLSGVDEARRLGDEHVQVDVLWVGGRVGGWVGGWRSE